MTEVIFISCALILGGIFGMLGNKNMSEGDRPVTRYKKGTE